MKSVSISRLVSSGLLLATAIAGSSNAQSPTPPPSGENKVQLTTGIVFGTFGEGSERIRQMRERLQDPEQRAALRAEHRGYIVDSNYDVAEVLDLDASTYEKLIELLTDQLMAQIEEFHLRDFSRSPSPDVESRLQPHLERRNREIELLRDFLGQQKLERFQAFQNTLGERRQLRELDGYLKAADKLNPTQKEQLVELFRDHYERLIQDSHAGARAASAPSAIPPEMPSQEELQRRSQLMTIESNENNWRRAPESNRKLREQAAAFLTASQLSALEQLQADKLKDQQQWIQQMRVQAGLSPDIPAAAEAAEPAPAMVARDVRIRMKVAVNRGNPATFTQIVSSGTAVTFEVDEGLLVQATPTLFANDTYALRVEYLEQGTTGNRVIGNASTMGTLDRTPSDGWASMGGSISIVSGSKAYAIELSSSVEAT